MMNLPTKLLKVSSILDESFTSDPEDNDVGNQEETDVAKRLHCTSKKHTLRPCKTVIDPIRLMWFSSCDRNFLP